MKRQLHADGWTTVEGVAVRGRAFGRRTTRCEQGVPLSGRGLAEEFHAALDRSQPAEAFDAICTVAAGLEGFFAAVIDGTPSERTERAYLVADGARSIPLYYDDDGSIVSDRGRLVQHAIDADRDPIAESELLLTRYVTGPETIWSRISVTQPGEVVALPTTRGRTPDLCRRTYREYRPTVDRDAERTDTASVRTLAGTDRTTVLRSKGAAKAALRAGLETALDRTERVAGERPIVIPLSGGYDSRLLAASLVERGRDVVGFTFGRFGHPDVETSREIATALDIEWHHVNYGESDWQRWYHGADCRRYRADTAGDSIPFLAEWPALRTLIEEERLPDGALFCPGHTVATPSGRLPAFSARSTDTSAGGLDDPTEGITDEPRIEPTVSALTEYVVATQYALWDWNDPTFRAAVHGKIRRGLLGDRDPTTVDDPDSAAAAYERWEWRGRMAAFTNGDLRAYEDVSADWWLPLWDPAYVRAWERLPLEYRRDRRLHIELAIERYRSAASKSLSKPEAARTDRTLPEFDRALSLLRHTPEQQFTRYGGEWLPPFLVSSYRFNETGSHPLAWYGAVDPELLERFDEPPDFYSLRTLAETGYLDLADPSGPVPADGTLTLPAAERSSE